MPVLLFLLGLFLLLSALGFETSIPDVKNRLVAAFTPATTWRFFRAVLAALLILVAVVSEVTGPGRPTAPRATYSASDAKSVYAAVAAFQKAHGLAPDGVVGSKTCPLLYKTCPVK